MTAGVEQVDKVTGNPLHQAQNPGEPLHVPLPVRTGSDEHQLGVELLELRQRQLLHHPLVLLLLGLAVRCHLVVKDFDAVVRPADCCGRRLLFVRGQEAQLKDACLIDLGHEGERGLLHGALLVLARLNPLQVAVGIHQLGRNVGIHRQGIEHGLCGGLKLLKGAVRWQIQNERRIAADRLVEVGHAVQLVVRLAGRDGSQVVEGLEVVAVLDVTIQPGQQVAAQRQTLQHSNFRLGPSRK